MRPPSLLALALLVHRPALADELLLTRARLWDGTGAPVRETDILVRDGRIAGFEAPSDREVPVLDLGGATVTPGLIDTHVHLVSNPGNAWRQDDEASRVAQVRQALRANVACGVTTVLDAGTFPPWAAQVRAWLDAGAPGPEVLDLGVALSPPGGYLDHAFPGYPSESNPEELRAQLDASDALGAVGYKVVVERGYGAMRWPVFDEAMSAALVEEAARRGKGLYVHAGTRWAVDEALKLKPRAMVHMPDPLRDDQLDALDALDARFSSTLLTTEHFMDARHQERLQRPLPRLVVPEAQQRTALAADIGARERRVVAEMVFPRSRLLQGIAARQLADEGNVARALAKKAETLRQLRARGLLVAMGSDAGNWPVFPFMFHGPSALAEIELLGEAGLTPIEALLAATRDAARFLDIEGRTGTVELGKEADLAIFREDPTQDLRAVYSVAWTVNDGELRTPEGWMRVEE